MKTCGHRRGRALTPQPRSVEPGEGGTQRLPDSQCLPYSDVSGQGPIGVAVASSEARSLPGAAAGAAAASDESVRRGVAAVGAEPAGVAWARWWRSAYILLGVFGPMFAPYDYAKQNLLADQSAAFERGASAGDRSGRAGLFSRLSTGIRISLIVGFGITAISMVVGTAGGGDRRLSPRLDRYGHQRHRGVHLGISR